MKNIWRTVIMIVLGAVGSFYTFVDPRTIAQWGLGLGMRHNNRVMIAILLLIVAVAMVYAMIREKAVGKK